MAAASPRASSSRARRPGREGDADVAAPVARQVGEAAAVVALHPQDLGSSPTGSTLRLKRSATFSRMPSGRSWCACRTSAGRCGEKITEPSAIDGGRQRDDRDACGHEAGRGIRRDAATAPADARDRRLELHVDALRVVRQQRAVAARDHEVLAVLDVLVRVERGEVRRLDAFPGGQLVHRHRVPGIGERLLRERRLRGNVEAAAAGAVELALHALRDRAVAGGLGAVHAPRAVVDLARETVGQDFETVLARVVHPRIDVRRMQPGAAAIPGRRRDSCR